MRLFDGQAGRRLDLLAVKKYGLSVLQMMEAAGGGVARIVAGELAACKGRRVSVIAGKGANGGDGFVAARHLMSAGVDVKVFCTEPINNIRGEASVNAAIWMKMGGMVTRLSTKRDIERHSAEIRSSDVIVDAIFGTGLSSEVKGVVAGIIDLINGSQARVVAVDIPSGIDASTGGRLGPAVEADVTAAMAVPKIGSYLYPGRACSGRVEVVGIGLSIDLLDGVATGNVALITDALVSATLRPRRVDGHKGSFGHLLVIAGSAGMTGAAYMSGVAAMRTGAGLVTIALPESLNAVMEAKTTEVMTRPLPEAAGQRLGLVSYGAIIDALAGKTAAIIGPGLCTSDDTAELLSRLIKIIGKPLLIDASGLDAISTKLHLLKRLKCEIVLTPHPGEAGRLLGISADEVQSDRVGAAWAIAKKSGAVVVLKGAGTVIADSSGRVFINQTGNPGLATAGTGDVLSGMIGAFLSQGYGAMEAAYCGVHIHGICADEIKKSGVEAGMMATDLLPVIPRVLGGLSVGAGK
ncbi:MAG: NAD(P)H-hydrate dehydratase [Deltaproteobacteria bacterium]